MYIKLTTLSPMKEAYLSTSRPRASDADGIVEIHEYFHDKIHSLEVAKSRWDS